MKVIVIGGGAAGMMAAVTAAENGADVTLLERNPFLGKKLRITGKGRCNVTNDCSPNEVLEAVSRNPKFLYGAMFRFSPKDTMAFFENAGVPLKTERGRRVFPVSDKAADIQTAFIKKLKESGARVICDARVKEVRVNEYGTYDVMWRTKSMTADSVIFATGGVSYPGTGSTGDGHDMLEKMGVSITPLKPSLVPIVTFEDYSELSGLTLKNVRLTAKLGEQTVYSEMGEMLFTHFGVSGPLVLSASANMQKRDIDEYTLHLNLKPALSREELDARLISDFKKYAARDFINSLGDLLPQKLIPYVVSQSKVDGRKKTGSLTKEERGSFLDALVDFKITPKSFRPIDEAIITSGGVDVKEISPKTMELKAYPGIYVCGEIIDVDAYTGGYNLQIAFATGKLAGEAAALG